MEGQELGVGGKDHQEREMWGHVYLRETIPRQRWRGGGGNVAGCLKEKIPREGVMVAGCLRERIQTERQTDRQTDMRNC